MTKLQRCFIYWKSEHITMQLQEKNITPPKNYKEKENPYSKYDLGSYLKTWQISIFQYTYVTVIHGMISCRKSVLMQYWHSKFGRADPREMEAFPVCWDLAVLSKL